MSRTVAKALPSRGLDDAEGDVAGAAGDVEHRPAGASRRVEPGDHRVLPEPVQAARHQVVHQVVAAGDLVEHLVDERLLFAVPDLGNRRRFPCPRRPWYVVLTFSFTVQFRPDHSRSYPTGAIVEGAVSAALGSGTDKDDAHAPESRAALPHRRGRVARSRDPAGREIRQGRLALHPGRLLRLARFHQLPGGLRFRRRPVPHRGGLCAAGRPLSDQPGARRRDLFGGLHLARPCHQGRAVAEGLHRRARRRHAARQRQDRHRGPHDRHRRAPFRRRSRSRRRRASLPAAGIRW